MTKSFSSQFIESTLLNSAKIPHDPKFPYLQAFGEKMHSKYSSENENISASQVIKDLNKEIKKNAKLRLFSGWFSTSSSTATGVTGAALNIADMASKAASVALPVLSTIPAIFNVVYGAMNKGWKLNRDLEGRGYWLKYLENSLVAMTADLWKKRVALREELASFGDYSKQTFVDPNSEIQPADQDFHGFDPHADNREHIEATKRKLKALDNTLRNTLKQLWQFNETHYKKEPFYYKWASMAFKGIGSLTGVARVGLSIAAAATAFFSAPAAIGLSGALVVTDLVFTKLYRKSHQLRNEAAEKCGANIDNCLEDIFDYYKTHENVQSFDDLRKIKLPNSRDSQSCLIEALKEFEPKKYAEFLLRNHPKKIDTEYRDHLSEDQQKVLDKKLEKLEKKERKHHRHNHHHNHKHHHHHHHHSHNILDRYFDKPCSHNLREGFSSEAATIVDLALVECREESGETKLPFQTHIHLPSLTTPLVTKPMQAIEVVTGQVARRLGGANHPKTTIKKGRGNKVAPEQRQLESEV